MLTIHALGAGRDAGSYYTNDPNKEARPHRRDEYYVGSPGVPDDAGIAGEGGGVWWSSGETIVRHGAPVDREVFRDLCAGLDPRSGDSHRTARGLVRGAGEKHRAGWDLTFSGPKSLSVLWAAGDEAQRKAIYRAHEAAVEDALRFIDEEGLVEVRLGAGGKRRERSTDTVVARFDHYTSRAGDPNIHSHCVLLNVAGSQDGKHRTLESRTLFRWTKATGARYRLALAEQLRELGLRTREAGRGQIEIEGMPKALIDRFSKRGAEIEAAIGSRADATGRQKEVANLATRQGKDRLPTGDELEAIWREEFARERTPVWDRALAAGREPTRTPDPARIPTIGERVPDPFPTAPEVTGDGPAARAASQLLHHEIVIDRRELLERAYALAALTAEGTAEGVHREIETLERTEALRALTPSGGRNQHWTTPELARIERAMIDAVGRPDERGWFKTDAVEAALVQAPHLSDEQVEVVRSAASRDGVDLLLAGAGTGKTTAMKAVVDAARRSELHVVGLAPSWVAADELARSTGIDTFAMAKWLYDLGQGTVQGPDQRTVVIIDEASLGGTRDLSSVLTRVRDAGAKAILVGDVRQLEAVPAGGALRLIAERLERQATIERVRRQQVDWQRDASLSLARGDVAPAIDAYQTHGAIENVEGRDALLDRTIERWRELRTLHGDDVLLVTRRNRDVAALNDRARSVLRIEGTIAPDDRQLPNVDRQGRRSTIDLAIGDRVRFGASHVRLGLRNGTRARVLSIGREADAQVRLELEDGRQVEASWLELATDRKSGAPRIVHDYASTVYGVQGRTAAATLLCVSTEVNARDLYVSMTRHSAELIVAVDDTAVRLDLSVEPDMKRNVRDHVFGPERDR